MNHHTATRRRNLCPCIHCAGNNGPVHGTQRMSAECGCEYCRRAAEAYTRLREYAREEEK